MAMTLAVGAKVVDSDHRPKTRIENARRAFNAQRQEGH